MRTASDHARWTAHGCHSAASRPAPLATGNPEAEALFNSLIEHHHYLGYEQPVGEHLKYGFNPHFVEHGKSLGPIIGASIEYFSKPNDFNTAERTPVKNLPGMRTLPAGASFTIAIQYDGDDVSGASFEYFDRANKHTWTITVPPRGVPKAMRTPLIAFQLDLVGKSGGDRAFTKSGEGTITYTASDAMTVTAESRPRRATIRPRPPIVSTPSCLSALVKRLHRDSPSLTRST
jgi:hypothetical protein